MSSSTTTTTAAAILLLHLLLLLVPTAVARTEVVSCSQTNAYEQNDSYSRALSDLLAALVSSAPPTGFANLSAGTAPQSFVHGLALCRGDLNASSCSACLTGAAIDVVNECPGSVAGAVWYDGCRLRYSDFRFFSQLTPNPRDPFLYDPRTFRDRQLFQDRFGSLARDLQQRAANGTGLYASGSVELGGGTLYGMVQCTRDLTGELCAKCLEAPIDRISCCWDRVEMTFQGGSCYLRYATYLFFNASVVAPPVSGGEGESPPVSGSEGESPPPAGGPKSPPAIQNATAEKDDGGFTLNLGGKKHNYAAVIAIVIGVVILAFLLLIVIRSRKSKPKHILLGRPRNLELSESQGLKFNRLQSRKLSALRSPGGHDAGPLAIQKLDTQTLKYATENFSEQRRIGRGEFGAVYKADIPGQEFVVKRFTAKSKVDLAQLQKEFRTFSKLQHTNLVQLLSFHIENEGGEKLVVYEYLPNTSLDRILFDNRRRVLLDWGRRYKIIQGVAQGLLHLHGEGGLNIIHQNLKATNVLLDKHMEPKISDFCLPRLFEGSHSQDQNKKNSSLIGYLAPECTSPEISNAKSDVFSYGVLVLEIVTGQRNRDLLGSENPTNLLSYVWQYWKEEKALQVLDWSLGELYKGHEVLRCIHVGLLCVQEDPERRPNMTSIVQMLNSYSFTLSSPLAPPLRGRNGGSGPQNGSGSNSGNWDWKMYNHDSGKVSPPSPSGGGGWSDVKLESR